MINAFLVSAFVALSTIHSIPPCYIEDGSEGQTICKWDADSQGNGQGHDFVKVGETYLLFPERL